MSNECYKIKNKKLHTWPIITGKITITKQAEIEAPQSAGKRPLGVKRRKHAIGAKRGKKATRRQRGKHAISAKRGKVGFTKATSDVTLHLIGWKNSSVALYLHVCTLFEHLEKLQSWANNAKPVNTQNRY